MSHYSAEATVGSEEVLRKALVYFGPGGLGLALNQPGPCCLEFRGGGGHAIVVRVEGTSTAVELDTQEWDLQVRKFMRRITR